MKQTQVTVNLERPARKGGGDRYQGVIPDGTEYQVYIPQSITRANSLKIPFRSIQLTFTPQQIKGGLDGN